MSVFFKLDPIKLAEALESIGWSGGGGGDASIAYSATAPIAPSNGDLWYDTANTKLKLYSGGLWVSMSLSQAEYNSIMGVISTLSESLANADASATKAEEEATLAENAKDAILGMQVATGVAGSSVTWNGTTLTVPQGIQGIQGLIGKGITSVARTSGNGSAGTTDTYTITYSDATTSTFNVYNGADGEDGAVMSVAGRSGDVVLTKADVGLSNVDNTTDANKPVSTAQATAIGLKADKLNPTITGLKEVSIAMGANDIDLSLGNHFTKTISGATIFTVSNVATSGTVNSFILELTNAGSATITWFGGVKWASGTAPTLTTSGVDILGFYTKDGGTTYRGLVLAKDSK